MKILDHLFERNAEWARNIAAQDPSFFSDLAKIQSPEYLWIGCADSRVPANQIIDLPPGEVFVHRNIANVVVHSDLNCLSVIQYAVDVLKVKHIIVCGHYDCGGIKSAMDHQECGLIDNWLQHIKDVYRFHAEELDALPEEQRLTRLCELNVLEQVSNVCQTTIVRDAWRRGDDLSVHGWVYRLTDGILRNLALRISSEDQLKQFPRPREV